MSFDSLGLSPALLRAVSEQGYTHPTPIQSRVIPVVLEGRDVMAGAQTGTGKTAGFTLPLLQLLAATSTPAARGRVRALILTPTRELAAQVGESVKNYGKHLPLTSAIIYGGVSINPQIAQLRRGVDILVATPGRLLDHATQRTVDLRSVEIFVLDEADRMLDMGFLPDIRRVIALLPQRRQNLLFSATFPNDIRTLANKLLDSPVSVEVGERNAAAEKIEQAATSSTRVKNAVCCRGSSALAIGSKCSCSRARSTGRIVWPSSSSATGSAPQPFTATRARARARARSQISNAVRYARSWRPTSPRAASTSISCRTS
jgi:ATP-dependent RNA helicase RhlE